MLIKRDQPILVMRVNEFRSYSFIEEHCRVIKHYGEAWMLKIGKTIPERSLLSIHEAGSVLLLRTPKKTGGKWYASHFVDFHFGAADKSMIYPEYYHELQASIDELSLTGTWLKIDHLEEIDQCLLEHFSLIANKHSLVDVVNSTRTAYLYAKSDADIELK